MRNNQEVVKGGQAQRVTDDEEIASFYRYTYVKKPVVAISFFTEVFCSPNSFLPFSIHRRLKVQIQIDIKLRLCIVQLIAIIHLRLRHRSTFTRDKPEDFCLFGSNDTCMEKNNNITQEFTDTKRKYTQNCPPREATSRKRRKTTIPRTLQLR